MISTGGTIVVVAEKISADKKITTTVVAIAIPQIENIITQYLKITLKYSKRYISSPPLS
jgi:hypothetical protein